ncbi:MAG: peptidase S41 [Bacteroidetes bacterium GWE2_29_8]|nr:MAG: peptidase S41 [Bacteroidetes bacterium GWE2_29_8]
MKKLIVLFAFFLFSLSSYSISPLWLRYSAISPDGNTIVFSYKGDIYKVDSKGGKAVAVTTHSAYDFRPVWSPDGKSIAFASNRFGSFDIFLISINGGKPIRLTNYSSNAYPCSFTPDGQYVVFSSTINDNYKNDMFPMGYFSELYKVNINEKERPELIVSYPMEYAKYNKSMDKIIYQDRKGTENEWRKHHVSSVTRDIWYYDVKQNKHFKLTDFKGEDRDPHFYMTDTSYIYLSEEDGSFNVYKSTFNNKLKKQLTFHKNHPVRFLSTSNNGKICYTYNGEIYLLDENMNSSKVVIDLMPDDKENEELHTTAGSGATEMAVSPNGKEIAFVKRGEVFVTAVEYGTTKRITNTPEQERSVSFSPDGRTLLYASERDGSWKIYSTKIVKYDEPYFYSSTITEEEPIIVSEKESFQPSFSPDGLEVAFLEERTTLKVINLKTKKIRTVLDGSYNYSYTDGDQWYDWSPDGKWFLVQYLGYKRWSTNIGLLDAFGNNKITNLTESGYSNSKPKWMMKGDMMIWFTDRQGMRSHGSWGSQTDVYGMFFNDESYRKFNMTKQEEDVYNATEKIKKGKSFATDSLKDSLGKPIFIDFKNFEDRIKRLTINSSSIADAVLSNDGENLYYLAQFEKGYDLWVNKIKDNETKLLLKLDGWGGYLQFDKQGKYLFMYSGGKFIRVNVSNLEKKEIDYNAELKINRSIEREYMFEHVWRQVSKKFYDPQIHGIDWNFYKTEYLKYLPHINNNFDFAEMLSELLGELNASHTGSGFRYSSPNSDRTASLGIFYDLNFKGKGIKIEEVIEKGPLSKTEKTVDSGMIIEKINGVEITEKMNFWTLLNMQEGKSMLINIFDPKTNKRWEETIKPISIGAESELLYKRWVKRRREETERLSGGRIGYVHVRGMNDASFRNVYSEVFGRNNDKEAIIIDTRFNGGGWLHDDIATLFSGKRYVDYAPRGQYIGSDPMEKWFKKSIMLVSEGNYSDAHGTPYIYQNLGIGKLLGMPVPGTMTAVWWESLQDESIYFGIPQVGVKDMNGKYLENQELIPDYIIKNDPKVILEGRDQQIEKSVEILLKELSK